MAPEWDSRVGAALKELEECSCGLLRLPDPKVGAESDAKMTDAVFGGEQAVDAARFGHDPDAAAVRQQASFAEQTRAALAQTPGHPVPLEEQVCPLATFTLSLCVAFGRLHQPSHRPILLTL